jgi:2-polyprenyl-3-methyl-5-hydroxy-6-metoxy-1,4-benzoquinol methylase
MKFYSCSLCNSSNVDIINTYKHYAIVCRDCTNVSHTKKQKYFLEYIFPRSLALAILPRKAFLRLYSDRGDFKASDFYDDSSFKSTSGTEWRKSEVRQVLDQLALLNIPIENKKILDISGGPGYVGKELANLGADVIVTEFSESTVNAMNSIGGVQAIVFDYNVDDISEISQDKFDLIMIRSSIIFCPDLNKFIKGIKQILRPDGRVLLESIIPTMGEILWWQQLEYKFPYIYSQETIEKTFFKNGLSLSLGYRDYGGYIGVKHRSYSTISKRAFTWLVDFPMVLSYYFIFFLFKKPAIDCSLNHKMLTQIWSMKADNFNGYNNYQQGKQNKSKTFGYLYNGYLRDKK